MKAICHCDEECALYGDCCWDAAVRFATKTEFGDYLDVNAWQCLPLQKKDNLGDELVCLCFPYRSFLTPISSFLRNSLVYI